MASNVMGIGVSVFLRDHFSGRASRVAGSMQNLHRNALTMNRSMLQSVRAHNMGIAAVGAVGLMTMGRAVKASSKFGYTMQYVNSITEATGAEMKEASNQALNLGKKTIFTAQQVASGMQYMAMAGMKHEEVIQNIAAATNLAGATMSNLGGKGGAADIMTNIMATFQLSADKSERVADVLTRTVTSTNTDLLGMGEAMSYAGDTMKRLNIPMDEAAVMLGLIRNAGLHGSRAGTSLANMFRYLSKAMGEFATGRQGQAMGMLGLTADDFKDANGELKDRGTLLRMIAKASEGKTGVEGQNLQDAIFGVRGGRGLGPLLNQMDRYEELLKSVRGNSEGLAASRMGTMMETTEGHFKKLTSAVESLAITFGTKLEPIIRPVVKMFWLITKAIEGLFNIPFLGSLTAGWVAGWILVKTAAAAYKIVLTTIGLAYQANTTLQASNTAATVAGWNAKTAAAATYGRTAAMATAMGGVGVGPTVMTGGARYFKGGAPVKGMTPKGAVGMKKVLGGMKYGAASRVAGGAAGVGRAVAGGAIVRALPWLGRLLPFFSRFLAFLGPIGLTLSILIPAVTGLISVFGGNTDAIKANTSAINGKKAYTDPINRFEYNAPRVLTELKHAMDYQKSVKWMAEKRGNYQGSEGWEPQKDTPWADRRSFSTNEPNPIPINITIDGLKTLVQQEVENNYSANLPLF